MSIAYLSAGAGNGTETNAAALNLACPATVNANDILVAHVVHLSTTTAPSTPAGWTLLHGPVNLGVATIAGRAWVFGKLAAGTEDGTNVNFGTAGGTAGRYGRIYSFSGYVSGTLAEVVLGFSDIPDDADPQMPTVTTTITGGLAVALVAQDDNNSVAAATGATGGTWTEPVAEYVNTAIGAQGCMAQLQVSTPTADPGTITGGAAATQNDQCSVIGFEIRPQVPVVPTIVPVDPANLSLSGVTATAGGTGAVVAAVDPATLGVVGIDSSLAGTALAVPADPAILSLAGVEVGAGSQPAALFVTVDPAVLDLAGLDVAPAGSGVASITVDPATLDLAGLDATPAGTGTATLSVDPATLTLAGLDVGLVSDVALIAVDPAVVVLTGGEAQSQSTVVASVDPALLDLAGNEVGLVGEVVSIPVDTAVVVLVGPEPALAGEGQAVAPVDPAVLVITGMEGNGSGSGGVVLTVDPGPMILVGPDADASPFIADLNPIHMEYRERGWHGDYREIDRHAVISEPARHVEFQE